MVQIKRLTAEEATHHLPSLVDLLVDCVNSGASIGFLPPLSTVVAQTYWQEVIAGVEKQSRLLLVALAEADQLVGTVQLGLESKLNGLHRAEVQKLLVYQHARGQGIGRQLMEVIEQAARQAARSLLVLDTRQGDIAEKLYQTLGYTQAGVIPFFARNSEGGLDATVLYYKYLGDA